MGSDGDRGDAERARMGGEDVATPRSASPRTPGAVTPARARKAFFRRAKHHDVGCSGGDARGSGGRAHLRSGRGSNSPPPGSLLAIAMARDVAARGDVVVRARGGTRRQPSRIFRLVAIRMRIRSRRPVDDGSQLVINWSRFDLLLDLANTRKPRQSRVVLLRFSLGGHARRDSGARATAFRAETRRARISRPRLAPLVPLAEMSTGRALQRKRAELESVEHALGTTFQRIAVGSRRLEALSHMDRAAEAWLAACIPGTEHHAEAFAAHYSSRRAALKQVRVSSLRRPSRAGI